MREIPSSALLGNVRDIWAFAIHARARVNGERISIAPVEASPMLMVAVAIAPGLFWLWYFLKRDRLRPEPLSLIRKVFFLGALSGVAAGVLERAVFHHPVLAINLQGHWNLLVAAGMIGLVEEGMKFFAVYLGAYHDAEFNEVLDGIIYAVTASMGFATLENILYVFSGGIEVGALRAVVSVPGHAFFAALMGFNMGMAKFAGGAEWRWLVSGWLLASLAHGLFDAVVLTQTALAALVIPLVLVLWRRAVIQAREAKRLDDQRVSAG